MIYVKLSLKLTMENIYEQFEGVVYKQIEGIMEAGYGHCRVIALSRYRLVHNAITRQRDNAITR